MRCKRDLQNQEVRARIMIQKGGVFTLTTTLPITLNPITTSFQAATADVKLVKELARLHSSPTLTLTLTLDPLFSPYPNPSPNLNHLPTVPRTLTVTQNPNCYSPLTPVVRV